MVAFVAPFPDPVVGSAVGPGDVVHQVLKEIHFVTALHHRASALGQLRQLQQKQGGGIELEMPPGVVSHHRLAGATVVFGVKGVEGVEALLEALHLLGLPHHRAHQAAHEGHHPLLQLPGAQAVLPLLTAVGQGQSPDALHRIDAVPHPGIAVVAMDGVSGAGGEQAADRVLPIENHPLDGLIQTLKGRGVVLRKGFRRRHNHALMHHHP